MCPICWATALASFATIIAVSVVTVAGTDRFALATAAVLGLLAFVHRFDFYSVPWWCLAAVIFLAAARIVYLIIARRKLLVTHTVWQLARQIAHRRCPRKRTASEVIGAQAIAEERTTKRGGI